MTGTELWHNSQLSWLKQVEIDPTQISDDQILVKALFSLVSQGTEKLVLSSKLDLETSKYMSFPTLKGVLARSDFTYGYALTGQVIAGNPNLLNKYVHLLHPHQSYAIVAASEAFLIPDASMVQKATLLSNLETVINAIWDSHISIGDEVLVIGYGGIGALLAQVINQTPGVNITIKENDPKKKLHALELFETATQRRTYDLVFHTSGTEDGLQYGIDRLKKESKLIELSWYGPKEVQVLLGKSFHYDRKQIIASQVTSIPYFKSSHWNYTRRKQLALKLLSKINFEHLITNTIRFCEAPTFYNKLRRGEINEIGTLITY